MVEHGVDRVTMGIWYYASNLSSKVITWPYKSTPTPIMGVIRYNYLPVAAVTAIKLTQG